MDDLVCCFFPFEWAGVFVPVVGPLLDCVCEFFDSRCGCLCIFLFGSDFCEPAFYKVNPWAVGRCEVENNIVDASMLPAFNFCKFYVRKTLSNTICTSRWSGISESILV